MISTAYGELTLASEILILSEVLHPIPKPKTPINVPRRNQMSNLNAVHRYIYQLPVTPTPASLAAIQASGAAVLLTLASLPGILQPQDPGSSNGEVNAGPFQGRLVILIWFGVHLCSVPAQLTKCRCLPRLFLPLCLVSCRL